MNLIPAKFNPLMQFNTLSNSFHSAYLWLCVLGLLILPIPAIGQALTDELIALNTQRLSLNQNSMMVLGSWALGNIVSGAILRGRTEGSVRYFHEMNIFWNLINAGIAGAAIYGNINTQPETLSLWETYAAQQNLEKILLFNCALNLSYIVGGFYLVEKAKTTSGNSARLKGYGQSLWLQGGFLLVFDSIQYFLHHTQAAPTLQKLLSSLHIQGQSLGISVAF